MGVRLGSIGVMGSLLTRSLWRGAGRTLFGRELGEGRGLGHLSRGRLRLLVSLRLLGRWDFPKSLGMRFQNGLLGLTNLSGITLDFLQVWIYNSSISWHFTNPIIDIKNAFQALALDEHRAAFTPTLFYVPTVTKVSQETLSKQQDLQRSTFQAWLDLLATKRPSLEDL
jgi:hypothetical protein